MTLIGAFRASRGIVIVADSQETVVVDGQEYKHSVLKIRPETVGNFEISVCGGGNGEAIDSFIERLKRALAKSKSKTLAGFRELFEAELYKTRKRLANQGDDADMHFIVAARIKDKYEVWSTASDTLIPVGNDKPCLIGFTADLYKHLAHTLYSSTLPVGQLLLAGLRILDLARQTCTCVDRPYSAVVVTPVKIFTLDDKLLDELTESITIFGAALDRMLLACSDTTLTSNEFIDKLREFESTSLHLRKEYLQTIGTMSLQKQMGDEVGYGISLTPSGTISSVSIDEKTGDLTFEVRESPEEVRHNLQALENKWPLVLTKLIDFAKVAVTCPDCKREVIFDSAEITESQFAPFVFDRLSEANKQDLLAGFTDLDDYRKKSRKQDMAYLRCPYCQGIHAYGYEDMKESKLA
jgi:hypothetical protein